MIESVNNDKVKYWTKLKDKKYQDREGLFLVEGEHLVEEAKKKGLLREVILLDGVSCDFEVTTTVSENVMKKISDLKNAPKMIGVVSKPVNGEICGKVLLLDGIQDPGNMGTIIRSAVAFNIDTIIIGRGSVSIYNPKVLRASEGMIFSVNIIEDDLHEVIPKLKKDDYKIYATSVTNGVDVKSASFDEKSAVIIGSEAKGVSDDLISLSDASIYIKMNFNCESLNAGVAASIILYELNK